MTASNLMIGGVTDSRIRARAKIIGSSAQYVAYDPVTAEILGTTGTLIPDAQGMVSPEITGLDPNRIYLHGYYVDSVFDTNSIGRFKTFPTEGEPASFRFVSSSCSGSTGCDYPWVTGVSNSPEFEQIRATDALFFAHIGDLHYKNITSGLVADYRAGYEDVLSSPFQQFLYKNMPLVYIWDDHDFSDQNSDGVSYTGRTSAGQVYRERVPSYDLGDTVNPTNGGCYHSFNCARGLFVALDSRYYRSPDSDPDGPSKTMLGSGQKAWLESVLSTSDAKFLVCFNQVQWMSGDSDSWGGFATERDELVQMFGDYGWLDKMCMINGDYHGLGLDHGSKNIWGGFPVFLWSSIDSNTSGNPDTSHIYDTGVRQPGRAQWGQMFVRDRGHVIDIRGTAYMAYPRSWRTFQFSVKTTTPLVL